MPDDINIGYVSEPGTIGGGEISLLTLLDNLPSHYRPHLLTYADGELVTRAQDMGVVTEVVPRGGPASTLSVVRRGAAWMRQSGLDIVHVNTLDIRAGLSARWAGIPLIGHLRVIMPFTWVDRWFVNMSSATISVSEAAAGALSRGHTRVRNKISIIPNTVAPPGSDPSLRDELGLSEKDILVGSIGRFDPVKGFEYLIEAIAQLCDRHEGLRLVLIGAPGDAEDQQAYDRQLRADVEKAGLQDTVAFTGFRENAAALLAGLDIMVVPSVPRQTDQGIWEEGFGRVATEGMSAGVPVIVSDSGGLAEIVEEDVTGKVVPPADSAALAGAIETLIGDKQLRDRLGEEGRRVFESRYTVEKHIADITNVYLNVLGATE